MKNLFKSASVQNTAKFIHKDIAPQGGKIENGSDVVDRTALDLSSLKTETEKQNALRDQVKTSLESLNPKNLLDTRITAKKRDTLGSLALGMDRLATVRYKKVNNITGKLTKAQHKEKELNINWATKVEMLDDKGAVAKTIPVNKAKLNPGNVVSFRKDGEETIIVVSQKEILSPAAKAKIAAETAITKLKTTYEKVDIEKSNLDQAKKDLADTTALADASDKLNPKDLVDRTAVTDLDTKVKDFEKLAADAKTAAETAITALETTYKTITTPADLAQAKMDRDEAIVLAEKSNLLNTTPIDVTKIATVDTEIARYEGVLNKAEKAEYAKNYADLRVAKLAADYSVIDKDTDLVQAKKDVVEVRKLIEESNKLEKVAAVKDASGKITTPAVLNDPVDDTAVVKLEADIAAFEAASKAAVNKIDLVDVNEMKAIELTLKSSLFQMTTPTAITGKTFTNGAKSMTPTEYFPLSPIKNAKHTAENVVFSKTGDVYTLDMTKNTFKKSTQYVLKAGTIELI